MFYDSTFFAVSQKVVWKVCKCKTLARWLTQVQKTCAKPGTTGTNITCLIAGQNPAAIPAVGKIYGKLGGDEINTLSETIMPVVLQVKVLLALLLYPNCPSIHSISIPPTRKNH